jgi:hypothetical protein
LENFASWKDQREFLISWTVSAMQDLVLAFMFSSFISKALSLSTIL